MIGIVDYGIGNLTSVMNALNFLDYGEQEVCLVARPEVLNACDRIILPGVGAFADAMKKINQLGFDEAIREQAQTGKPLLGICLGMQLLGSSSDEGGATAGLGLIPGHVEKISWDGVKVPHMGWNSVEYQSDDSLFTSIPNHSDFYFVHSYHFVAGDEYSVGTTSYGEKFTSIIRNANVCGVQFHPEKSQKYGLALLKNFIEL